MSTKVELLCWPLYLIPEAQSIPLLRHWGPGLDNAPLAVRLACALFHAVLDFVEESVVGIYILYVYAGAKSCKMSTYIHICS